MTAAEYSNAGDWYYYPLHGNENDVVCLLLFSVLCIIYGVHPKHHVLRSLCIYALCGYSGQLAWLIQQHSLKEISSQKHLWTVCLEIFFKNKKRENIDR